MPKQYVIVGFKNTGPDFPENRTYQSEIGVDYDFTSRWVLPPHLTNISEANLELLGQALNWYPLRYSNEQGEQIIRDVGNQACSVGTLITPYKFQFVFSNGSSTAIPVNMRRSAAGDGDDVFETAEGILTNQEASLVCGNLLPERIPNANSELGVDFDINTTIESAGRGRKYSNSFEYTSSFNRQNQILKAAVESESSTQIPPIFDRENIWVNCVGENEDIPFSCPGSSKLIEPRKYIVQYSVTTEGSAYRKEQRQIPLGSASRSDIQDCGEKIANHRSVFCISYIGEKRRFING